MLEDFGLEPERFRLEWIASSEAQKFADVMTEMTEHLRALGPEPVQHQGIDKGHVGMVLSRPCGFPYVRRRNNDHPIGPEKWTAKNSCGTAGPTTAEAEAQQVMHGYEQDGFETLMLVVDDQYLVYSRRVAAVQPGNDGKGRCSASGTRHGYIKRTLTAGRSS